MRTRRQVLGAVTVTVLAGCSDETDESPSAAGLFVPSISAGEITETHTCDGGDSSPSIEISDVSPETGSFALIMDDLDAPGPKPFVHWRIWNIPPNTTEIPGGVPKRPTVELSERKTAPGFPGNEASGPIVQGTNSAGEVGYTGPCPPRGEGPHTYEFTVLIISRM